MVDTLPDDDLPAADDRLVLALRDVLSGHDPEGLLRIGAPQDEYQSEARHFARLATAGHTLTPDLVRQVWEQWFSPAGSFLKLASPQELAELAGNLNTTAAELL